MTSAIQSAISTILSDRDLSLEQTQAAFSEVMDGLAKDAEIAALLTALRMKGEKVSEIVGAARAMIDRATKIPTRSTGTIDTCGTGGDGLGTFNISTATAFVVAAAGIPVAKHGNRSVSSSSGSADVLEAMGVRIDVSPENVGHCIDEIGLGFCFAPLAHQAMKHAAPVRKTLGFRTIFNLLGPLTNPADAQFQLIGTPRIATAEKLAHALVELGRERAVVVSGNDELDEVCLWGETTAFIVKNETVRQETWTAEMFGLPECHVEGLIVKSPEESAKVILEILEGKPGVSRDMVVANSSVALFVAGKIDNLKQGVEIAQQLIDDGKAKSIFRQLVEKTNSVPS